MTHSSPTASCTATVAPDTEVERLHLLQRLKQLESSLLPLAGRAAIQAMLDFELLASEAADLRAQLDFPIQVAVVGRAQ